MHYCCMSPSSSSSPYIQLISLGTPTKSIDQTLEVNRSAARTRAPTKKSASVTQRNATQPNPHPPHLQHTIISLTATARPHLLTQNPQNPQNPKKHHDDDREASITQQTKPKADDMIRTTHHEGFLDSQITNSNQTPRLRSSSSSSSTTASPFAPSLVPYLLQ